MHQNPFEKQAFAINVNAQFTCHSALKYSIPISRIALIKRKIMIVPAEYKNTPVENQNIGVFEMIVVADCMSWISE